MHKQYFMLTLLLSVTIPVMSMWQQTSGQKENYRYTVNFETTVAITCNNPDASDLLKPYLQEHSSHHVLGCRYYECNGTCYKSFAHPLISAGSKPYQYGNGGLLNPVLKEYNVESVITENGVQVTIKGAVETSGFAPYHCNATKYGQSSNNDATKIYTYEMDELEEAILGALLERSADRRLSDFSDEWFSYGSFTNTFFTCVKQEWSSQLSEDDNGKRCSECTDLIKRYFPRSVYWRSQWYHDAKNERAGKTQSKELERKFPLNTPVKIELTEFKISVEPALDNYMRNN